MFLLDTNVVSELNNRRRAPSANVLAWAANIPADRLFMSSVTVLELQIGVLAMERRDAAQAKPLRLWLNALLTEFSARIHPFTTSTAMLCAPLHVPNRRPERDAMIAATAKEHGYVIVTRNTRDFEDCGVQVLNPWL